MNIRELEIAFAAFTGPFADALRDVFHDWRSMQARLEHTANTGNDINALDAEEILYELRIQTEEQPQ